jgi:hypothetical protein
MGEQKLAGSSIFFNFCICTHDISGKEASKKSFLNLSSLYISSSQSVPPMKFSKVFKVIIHHVHHHHHHQQQHRILEKGSGGGVYIVRQWSRASRHQPVSSAPADDDDDDDADADDADECSRVCGRRDKSRPADADFPFPNSDSMSRQKELP